MGIGSRVRRQVRLTAAILGLVVVSHFDVAAESGRAANGANSSAPSAAKSITHRPWMDLSLTPEERSNLLIKEMTLDEKVTLMHGMNKTNGQDTTDLIGYAGYVPPNLRLGIPALRLADGRAGVGNKAENVTLLPAPIAAASAW